jgi:hypothetical protein
MTHNFLLKCAFKFAFELYLDDMWHVHATLEVWTTILNIFSFVSEKIMCDNMFVLYLIAF